MRWFVLLALVACGGPEAKPEPPTPLPRPLVTPASTEKPSSGASTDPVDEVQAVLPHLLDLLAHGEDERFIDEVVVPEEREKVFGRGTKQQLVADFKTDKHDEVVAILLYVRTAKPVDVKRDEDRTYVKYEVDGTRRITFVVEGRHVYIRN